MKAAGSTCALVSIRFVARIVERMIPLLVALASVPYFVWVVERIKNGKFSEDRFFLCVSPSFEGAKGNPSRKF